jgi:Zn-dependent protease
MDLSLERIALAAVPVILAITLHEASHRYVAKLFGDRTAEMLGRVTLNPLKHIDPVGTLLVPGILLLMSRALGGGFIFGWAKPVPVNFNNLRNPKRDMFWVAAAGPASNFVMALGWVALAIAVQPGGAWPSDGALFMAQAGIQINLVLMALNLLPIPPLDGGRIAVSLLPGRASYALSRVEPYGLFIILALLATGMLNTLMRPLLVAAQYLIGAIVAVFVGG